jgi:nicotinamide-nucleotide amidase
MTSAEIIAIGTELLLGETQDTNTRDMAIFLKENGIDLYRTTIIGDNKDRITAAIREALGRADIVITSGGLGPTVDDPTREAVAAAAGVETVFSEELWAQIEDRFRRFGRTATSNNKKQAFIPKGAIPVENRVGTAPAFIVEVENNVIISLPGVPRELQHLLKTKIQPYLNSRYGDRQIIGIKVLHTSGLGESQVDELISDLETHSNPTVGLSAHPGQVDIRITAKGKDQSVVDEMLDNMASEVSLRLGDRIFGEDQVSLEEIAVKKIKETGLKAEIFHQGLGVKFETRLVTANFPENNIHSILNKIDLKNKDDCNSLTENYSKQGSTLIMIACLFENGEQHKLFLKLETPTKQLTDSVSYGGPPELSQDWAANQVFDFLRRNL